LNPDKVNGVNKKEEGKGLKNCNLMKETEENGINQRKQRKFKEPRAVKPEARKKLRKNSAAINI